MKPRRPSPLLYDRGGFTRLEFGLLAAMLLAMVVNGVATLGGLGGSIQQPAVVMPTDVSSAMAAIRR